MAAKHIIVEGKVQGVGFRFHVKKLADQFSMTGWTRNLIDGRVEILAAGTEENFKLFEAGVRQGPPQSVVDRVTIKELENLLIEIDFIIKPDGRNLWPN